MKKIVKKVWLYIQLFSLEYQSIRRAGNIPGNFFQKRRESIEKELREL
jgi:hypothetical protein